MTLIEEVGRTLWSLIAMIEKARYDDAKEAVEEDVMLAAKHARLLGIDLDTLVEWTHRGYQIEETTHD